MYDTWKISALLIPNVFDRKGTFVTILHIYFNAIVTYSDMIYYIIPVNVKEHVFHHRIVEGIRYVAKSRISYRKCHTVNSTSDVALGI